MFLRRQQNAHKWTKSGPDPQPERPSMTSVESKTVRAGHVPLALPPPATVSGVQVEPWNSMADSRPVRTGVSLLRRSDSADHVSPAPAAAVDIKRSADAEQWTSNTQHQVPAPAAVSSQTLSYRPVKFQFQKPAGSLPSQHWKQAPATDRSRGSLPGVATSHNIMHVSHSGFSDL